MLRWDVLYSGYAMADGHMRRDEELLSQLKSAKNPCLHHYDWLGESLTYGYFSKPEALLNGEAIRRRGMHVAKRPSGGGVLFHLTDLAFSVLVPAHHRYFSLNTLKNYAFVNQAVLYAIGCFLGDFSSLSLASESDSLCSASHSLSVYCMAQTTRYDLLLGGKKVGGAAQRRTRDGFLHQGSIYLASPPKELLMDVLPNGAAVFEAMQQVSQPLLGADACLSDLVSARQTLRDGLTQSLTTGIARFEPFPL